MCAVSGPVRPVDINNSLLVREEEIRIQEDLLIALLVREGYTVKLSGTHVVKNFKRSKEKDSFVYKEALCRAIDKMGEDGEGLRSLLFSTMAMKVLEKNGYIFEECICRAYNYPMYRRILSCYTPDNRIIVPSLKNILITPFKIKGNDIHIKRLIESCMI